MLRLRCVWRGLTLVALGLIPLQGAQRETKGSFWYGNDRFQVVGVDLDSAHEEFAMRYQVFCDTFDRYFGQEGWPKPHSRIVFVPSREDFRAVLGDAAEGAGLLSLGGFLEVDGDGVTVLNRNVIQPDSYLGVTVYLELDWRLRRSGWYLPPWVSQGIGAVYAFAEFEHRGALLVGNLPFNIRRWAADDLLDWDRFLAAGRAEVAAMTPLDRARYWAQSWGLVRWCIFRRDDPAAAMRDLAALTNRGASPAELQAYFGLSGDALTEAVLVHAGKRDYDRFKFDPATVDARMNHGPLTEAAWKAIFSDMMLASGDVEGAGAMLDEVLATVPGPLPVELELAQARRCLLAERHDEAVTLYRDAVDRRTESPFAWLISAEERVFDLEAPAAAGSPPEERTASLQLARDEVMRAIALDPSNGRAYNLLGRITMLAHQADPAVLELMEQRVGADAWGARVRGYRGILLARAGQTDAAMAELAIAIKNPELNATERSELEQRLAVIAGQESEQVEQAVAAALAELNALLEQGQVKAALALAKDREMATGEPVLRERYHLLRCEIEANVTRQRLASLIKQERWDDASALASRYLSELPDSPYFRDEIEALLRQAQQRR